MRTPIRIRPYERRDFWTVVALAQKCFEGAAALPREYLSGLLRGSTPAPTLMGLYEGRIVGFVIVVLREGRAYIEIICIDPAFQRRKIASQLLSSAESGIAKTNVTDVELHVRESNSAARALYAGAGYIETGVDQSFYSDGTDAVVMRKKLTN